MRRSVHLLFLLPIAGLLASSATAQPSSNWWDPVTPREGYDQYEDRYERRDEVYRYRGRAMRSGPPFCRNGAGHPVHGHAWCVEKGFAPPRYRRYRPQRTYPTPRRWRQYEGSSTRFRISYEHVRRWNDVLTSAELDIILDRRTRNRLYAHRRALDLRAAIEGRWVPARGPTTGRVLQLRAGRSPLAELADWNGDWRVDAMWLYEGARQSRR